MVFHRGGISTGWSFIKVAFQQGGLSLRWHFNRVVFHHGGISTRCLSSGWNFNKVLFIRVALTGWSFIGVVFHKDGKRLYLLSKRPYLIEKRVKHASTEHKASSEWHAEDVVEVGRHRFLQFLQKQSRQKGTCTPLIQQF